MPEAEKKTSEVKLMGIIRKIVLFILLAAMIGGWIYAAVLTAMPSEKASKLCLSGYKAHCSFTPISTMVCIIAVVITIYVAVKMIRK
jgi:hypothetical protein